MNGFHVWNLWDDTKRYDHYIKRCVNFTPYHLTEYLLAESLAESGITRIFCYEENGNFALIPEVVRKINDLLYMSDLNEELYDMIAPHEYGGIVSNSSDNILKYNLLKHIFQYCKDNNIIFQFIRLNPYLEDMPLIYQESWFEVLHSNAQVYVDLDQTEEQIFMNYKSSVQRNIRRAEKELLFFEIADKNQKNINAFEIMYQNAMEILEARKFLYFNNQYFHALLKCDFSKLALVRDREGRILAGSILLMDNNVVYYHLGCFDRNYSLKRPMNYLINSMVIWSRENGYKVFHLAGGHKSLLQFKEGYSDARVDYYIADNICDKEKYNVVCEKWKEQFPQYADENYFPLYRYNE